MRARSQAVYELIDFDPASWTAVLCGTAAELKFCGCSLTSSPILYCMCSRNPAAKPGAGEVHLETCIKDLRERFARIELQVRRACSHDLVSHYCVPCVDKNAFCTGRLREPQLIRPVICSPDSIGLSCSCEAPR